MIKLNIKSNDSLYDVLEEALSITERDGEVVLYFKQFTIIVRPK